MYNTQCTWPIQAHTLKVCDLFNYLVIKQVTSTSSEPEIGHMHSLSIVEYL